MKKGQTLIFLILIVLLGLTIVGSLAVRTIQDLKQSSYSEQSERAFSAAESGIEETLRQGLSGLAGNTINVPNLGNSSSYNCVVEAVGGGSDGYELYGSNAVAKDNVLEVNLDTMTGTSLDIYWVKNSETSENPTCVSGSSSASVLLNFIYWPNEGVDRSFQLIKMGFNSIQPGTINPCLGTSNGLTTAQASGNSIYLNKTTIDLKNQVYNNISKIKLLRIRPMYNKTSIKIVPGGSGSLSLPTQAYRSRCTGSLGDIRRVVEVIQPVAIVPPIFDYAIFNYDDVGLSHE